MGNPSFEAYLAGHPAAGGSNTLEIWLPIAPISKRNRKVSEPLVERLVGITKDIRIPRAFVQSIIRWCQYSIAFQRGG
jgi:hypothetical protein